MKVNKGRNEGTPLPLEAAPFGEFYQGFKSGKHVFVFNSKEQKDAFLLDVPDAVSQDDHTALLTC